MSIQKTFDALLVLQAQSGNKKALDQLVKRYHKRLCAHSYWYTGDIEASKDIVQDSWGIIINKLDRLRDPNSFGSWAMRIATRKSLDYLNKKKNSIDKGQSNYTQVENQMEDGNRENIVQKVKMAIATLSQNQQIVLRLFYTQEYSLKEIGNILDISTGTVKSRLFHAREKLKTILKTEL